jgi:hypothetical protein
MIEHILKTQLHEELATSESTSVFVTDGPSNIVEVMNRKMPTTIFRRIYPSTDVTSRHRFCNSIFGDTENCGKFLIELRDETVLTAIGISHYVSLDTEKLEIYDPMSVEGAIVTQRSSDGYCLLLETLQLHHTVKVFTVWKLLQKSKRVNCSMASMDTTEFEVPNKKKRKGKKQNKCYVPKK